MLKFTFLGTCSGTEPMPSRHHSSIVLEVGDKAYVFDAGENCSHTMYTSGIDVTRIRSVFISHMHIDHIGGLANLIFTLYKIAGRGAPPHVNNGEYDVFVPDTEMLEHVLAIGCGYRSPSSVKVKPIPHEVRDGLLYDDGNIRVSAIHNTHLREDGSRGWHAYSYLIEAEERRVVFSGDVGCPEELDPFVCDGCDLLIMETGHHAVSSVLDYATSRGVPRLLFTHHGREILGDPEAALRLIAERGVNARICNDGDSEIV